jgi:hypothetical protein
MGFEDKTSFEWKIETELRSTPNGWTVEHEHAVLSTLDDIAGGKNTGAVARARDNRGSRRAGQALSPGSDRKHRYRRLLAPAGAVVASVCIIGGGIWWVHSGPQTIVLTSSATNASQATESQFQLTFGSEPPLNRADYLNQSETFRVNVTDWPLDKLPKGAEVWLFPDSAQAPLQLWSVPIGGGSMPGWGTTFNRVLAENHLSTLPIGSFMTWLPQSVKPSKPYDFPFALAPNTTVNLRDVRLVAVALLPRRSGQPQVLWSKVFAPSDPIATALQTLLETPNSAAGASNIGKGPANNPDGVNPIGKESVNSHVGVTGLKIQSDQAAANGVDHYLLFTYRFPGGTKGQDSSTTNGALYEGLAVVHWTGRNWRVANVRTSRAPTGSQIPPLDVLELSGTLSSGQDYRIVGGIVRDNRVASVWLTCNDGTQQVAFVKDGLYQIVLSHHRVPLSVEGDNSQNQTLFSFPVHKLT